MRSPLAATTGAAVTEADHSCATLTEAIRRLADLQDVQRAISVAARLSAEKLAEIESDLVNMLAHVGEERQP
jgi:hypothetical protein